MRAYLLLITLLVSGAANAAISKNDISRTLLEPLSHPKVFKCVSKTGVDLYQAVFDIGVGYEADPINSKMIVNSRKGRYEYQILGAVRSERAGEIVVLTRHVGDGVKVAAMINDENGKILGIGDKNHYRDCGVRPPPSADNMQNFWSKG
ncbi:MULTISPECIES: hypothetical protein [Vibrio]|uniref:Uncharacterized protein n=1 Tax=Vibrio tasmaniensis TaxID=212663 RepID=A0A2N7NNR5_9VIBR|nr:hypothetical protein [Vibrio tasmaniensis]PMP18558.1 hypothetical protein BCS92_00270 [Vibrio tasmaniensis]TKG30589.1 hypothetical protein FC057_15780 [Vibrio tasmaniensis]TKG39870.1 hypothetical protein FC063_12250 [Vibrio tasmaniensis]TKG40921.1 hypothetical protein FC060_23250 [Vibrio tasmaniensis]TKG42410.1 hypothetical protein FC061_22540 [Vibrio tasmaniensis]